MRHKTYIWIFIYIVSGFISTYALAVMPEDLVEHRYGAGITRNADGSIHRSPAIIAAFRKVHPCPPTMKLSGACPNWQVDHIIPLACGGRDSVDNMGWFPTSIKTCADPHCIDRWERNIYALIPPVFGSSNCTNRRVP